VWDEGRGDSGGPAACAATRSFRTLNSDALVLKNGSALEFVGASGFGQDVIVSRTVSDGVARFTFFEGNNNGIVPAAGSGCTTDPGSPLDNVVRCSTSGITRIRLRLGDVSDGGFADTGAVPFTIDGGPGGDGLGGAGNRDFIVGGPGVDSQSSVIDCGENRDGSADADVAYIDDNGELHQDCEDVRTTTPPRAP
jgi:hypothetical protein